MPRLMQDRRSCVCKLKARKNMIPIPLLVFHFARAFGNVKSLINLIIKQKIMCLTNSPVLYAPVNFVNAVCLP